MSNPDRITAPVPFMTVWRTPAIRASMTGSAASSRVTACAALWRVRATIPCRASMWAGDSRWVRPSLPPISPLVQAAGWSMGVSIISVMVFSPVQTADARAVSASR